MASNIYLCNMDMGDGKNLKAWKSEDRSVSEFEDGKWRFLAYDMDCIVWAHAPDKEYSHRYEIDSFGDRKPYAGQPYDEDRVFSALKTNPEFCEKFVTRFLDLANSSYSIDEAIGILEKYGYNRDWNDSFLVYRLDYMAPALAKSFGLEGRLVNLGLQLNDPSMGKIRVNTVEPEMKDGEWHGRYYTDYPVKLVAVPEEGYEFVCWKMGATGEVVSTNEEFVADLEQTGYNKSDDLMIEAIFRR